METSNFVKQLSSNSRPVREKSLEALRTFLLSDKVKHSKQLQFDKLWKGLYYAMWFSDRPRPQQRLANKLGELYQLYFDEEDNKREDHEQISANDKAFIKFSKAFWKVLCIEWFNIDRYRLDKYLLLVRRVFFNQIKYLQSRQWNPVLVEKYIRKVLKSLPLSGDRKVYTGIPLHVTDIFLDEWERLYTNLDDEFEDANKEEGKERETVAEWAQSTPLKQFIAIFQDLKNDFINPKAIRMRIKEDLLTDSRLIEWGVLEDASSETTTAKKEEDGEDKEEDEEEWKGF